MVFLLCIGQGEKGYSNVVFGYRSRKKGDDAVFYCMSPGKNGDDGFFFVCVMGQGRKTVLTFLCAYGSRKTKGDNDALFVYGARGKKR